MNSDTSFAILTGNGVDTLSYRAGDIIFREGNAALELYVIKRGQVRIQIGNRTVTELAPDTIFGEMALIDDESRSATAIAATDVELVPVTERQFLFLVSRTPYFALKVMRVLAQRLRGANRPSGSPAPALGQFAVTRTGRLARLRRVLLSARVGSAVNSIAFTFTAIAASISCPSIRASNCPTHIWMPAPNPTWPPAPRSMT